MRKNIKIKKAVSLNNGIAFYSASHKGYVLLGTIDKNNTVKIEWISENALDNRLIKNEKNRFIFKIATFILLALVIITTFFTIASIVATLNFIYLLRFSFFSLFIFKIFLLIFNFQYNKIYNPYQFSFHSAEHMVVNAYENLGRAPTLEEIRTYSRFHYGCSISDLTQFAIFYLSVFICTYIQNLYFMIITISFIHLILMWLRVHGLLNFLQKFFTKSPTDRELKVAIETLIAYLEYENFSE